MLYNFSVIFFDVLAWIGIGVGVLAGILAGLAGILYGVGILRMFKVKEGTGTAFKLLGKYSFSVMSLNNFHFGVDEFIEPGNGMSDTGMCRFVLRVRGWVFYIKWFVEPTSYPDQNNADGFGEGYSVFLNQIQRDFTLEKAETKKGEEIPLNLKAAFKMRVVNIYKFLFTAPKDVIAKVIEILEAIHRAWIKGHSYNEIQEVSSNGGKMWDQFGQDIKAAIDQIKKDWGVEILKESISIMDVGLMPEDQQAFAEKKRQQLKTAAGAQEILGGMLEIEAMSMGFKGDDRVDKVLEELAKTPAGVKRLDEIIARANLVVTQRALGVKPNLFGNADGSPMDPLTGALASLIALAKGGGSSGGAGVPPPTPLPPRRKP